MLSGHDKGVASQDVDMMSMAQRMAVGAGRGATAFDAEMFQMGCSLLPRVLSPRRRRRAVPQGKRSQWKCVEKRYVKG